MKPVLAIWAMKVSSWSFYHALLPDYQTEKLQEDSRNNWFKILSLVANSDLLVRFAPTMLCILGDTTFQAVGLALLILVGGLLGYKKFAKAQKRKKAPKDVIILHQLPPGIRTPSPSPFVLKFETW